MKPEQMAEYMRKRREKLKAANEVKPAIEPIVTRDPENLVKGFSHAECMELKRQHRIERHNAKLCGSEDCPDTNTKLFVRGGKPYYLCNTHAP